MRSSALILTEHSHEWVIEDASPKTVNYFPFVRYLNFEFEISIRVNTYIINKWERKTAKIVGQSTGPLVLNSNVVLNMGKE